MGYFTKRGHIILVVAILSLLSCSDEVDYSGFFYTGASSNDRFEQSTQWNQSHPGQDIIVNADNYSFLIAGDSHCGPTASLDHFIEAAVAPDISFSILAGDMTSGQSYDYDTVFTHLARLGTKPCFQAIGNHDLFFDGWESWVNNVGTTSYTFTVTSLSGKDLFICLDTGTGTLGSKQMRWLKETLANTRENYRNCIVFTHVNFFREHRVTSTVPLVEELYVLLDLFADNDIDMVIMGHDHRRSVENFDETRYITLDALEDDFEYASYIRVTNLEGAISYKFIDVD
jgi:UDP-2,3-diacylglucosamine pyrophosphatase LpxH